MKPAEEVDEPVEQIAKAVEAVDFKEPVEVEKPKAEADKEEVAVAPVVEAVAVAEPVVAAE